MLNYLEHDYRHSLAGVSRVIGIKNKSKLAIIEKKRSLIKDNKERLLRHVSTW